VVETSRVTSPRVRSSTVARLLASPETLVLWSTRAFLPVAVVALNMTPAALVPLVVVSAVPAVAVVKRGTPSPLTAPLSLLELGALGVFAEADWALAGYRRPIIVGCCTVWLLLAAAASRVTVLDFVRALLDSIAIYLVANVLLYVVGVRALNASGRVTSSSSLGGGGRVQFPLDASLSVPPAMAAAYLTALAADLRRRRSRLGWVTTAVAIVSAVAILAGADSRTSIAVALAGLVLVAFASSKLARANVVLVPLLLLLPVWWVRVEGKIAPAINWIGNNAPGASRHSRYPLETLEGRTYVWRAIFNHLSSLSPRHLVYGYGSDGQVTSHISGYYAQYFRFLAAPGSASAQSTLVQQLLDAGVIGASLLLLVAGLGAWRFGRARFSADTSRRRAGALGTALLFSLAATAAIDRLLVPGTLQAPFLVFALLVGFVFLRRDPATGDTGENVVMAA
jgi:hypothetical protein